MSEHIEQTISDLQRRLQSQEEEARKTRRLINSLRDVQGKPPLYSDADIEGGEHGQTSIRRDQFYGIPLATAVREYLNTRRASGEGPATVNEIYDGLVRGGYKFSAKNDENAKRGLRISLTKSSRIFHRLPDGTSYGLTEWYPSVKNAKPDGDDSDSDDSGDEELEDMPEDSERGKEEVQQQ